MTLLTSRSAADGSTELSLDRLHELSIRVPSMVFRSARPFVGEVDTIATRF